MTTTYEPTAGERIGHACREAVRLAQRDGRCDFRFNDVPLTASAGDDPDALSQRYHDELERRRKAYWTPERIAARDAKEATDRQRLAEHIATLDSLDWSSLPAVCDWLCEFETRKFVHTPNDSGRLLGVFAEHGFVRNMCQSGDGESPAAWSARTSTDDKWRYIIGQCLDGIAIVGAPHQMCHVFAERLRNGDL